MGTVALGAVAVSSTAVFYIAACNTSVHHCNAIFSCFSQITLTLFVKVYRKHIFRSFKSINALKFYFFEICFLALTDFTASCTTT